MYRNRRPKPQLALLPLRTPGAEPGGFAEPEPFVHCVTGAEPVTQSDRDSDAFHHSDTDAIPHSDTFSHPGANTFPDPDTGSRWPLARPGALPPDR